MIKGYNPVDFATTTRITPKYLDAMNFYLLGRVRGRGGGFFDFLPLDMVGQELGL